VSEVVPLAKRQGFAHPRPTGTGSDPMTGDGSRRQPSTPPSSSSARQRCRVHRGKGHRREGRQASILGSIAASTHVHALPGHIWRGCSCTTDHCSKESSAGWTGFSLPARKHFAATGSPMFNLAHARSVEESRRERRTSASVPARMSKIGRTADIDARLTGGKSDASDISDKDHAYLYSSREDRLRLRAALRGRRPVTGAPRSAMSRRPTTGTWCSSRLILRAPRRTRQKFSTDPKPVNLVSLRLGLDSRAIARKRCSYACEDNMRTPTQWAFWDGIRHNDSDQARLPAGANLGQSQRP